MEQRGRREVGPGDTVAGFAIQYTRRRLLPLTVSTSKNVVVVANTNSCMEYTASPGGSRQPCGDLRGEFHQGNTPLPYIRLLSDAATHKSTAMLSVHLLFWQSDQYLRRGGLVWVPVTPTYAGGENSGLGDALGRNRRGSCGSQQNVPKEAVLCRRLSGQVTIDFGL